MSDGDRFLSEGRRGYHHGRLKDALIEAARSLVAERGPAGFTLAEAAKRVGVTAAAPYRHFNDRADLMSELARRGFTLFGDALERAWNGGRPDPVQAFRHMGAAYLDFAMAEPGLYSAMFGNVKALDEPGPGQAADKALATLRNAARAVLLLYGAPADGADALASEIWALSHGVAMLAMAGYFSDAHGRSPHALIEGAAPALFEAHIRRALQKR